MEHWTVCDAYWGEKEYKRSRRVKKYSVHDQPAYSGKL